MSLIVALEELSVGEVVDTTRVLEELAEAGLEVDSTETEDKLDWRLVLAIVD